MVINMRKWRFGLILSALGAMGLLMLVSTGCDSPAMRRARDHREQSLSRSLRIVGSLDDHRGDNLARTHQVIADRLERDTEAAHRNVGVIGRLFEEEFETWAEKEPAYRRGIWRELKGDGGKIERTVPYFIY
jgi:hypothetical protein